MRLAAPVLMLLAAIPSFAADQWIRLTTPHFELSTTYGEKRGRELILYFEQVRNFFVKTSPRHSFAEFPVRIIVFKSEKQFRPYAPNEGAAAFYQSGDDRDYIVMQNGEQESLPAAIHEYMHLVIKHSGIIMPVWLNEGWADVYSTLKPMGDKTMIGDLIPGRVIPLRDQKWLTIDRLLAVDEHSADYNEKNRMTIFYAESWALVHMLYLSPEYKQNVPKFLIALNSGQPAAEAFRTAWGRAPDLVYGDLRTYLSRNRLYGEVFGIKLAKSEEEAEMSPMPPFESELMLADLLAATNHVSAARAELERLGQADPARVEIQQSLGYLAWRSNDHNAARTYFEKAFAAGDKDPKMCFNLAMLEREVSEDRNKVVPPLLRALLVKDDYVDARLQLGAFLLTIKDYEGALTAFVRVNEVSSEQAPLLFNGLAYVKAQKGDIAGARSDLTEARKWDRKPRDVQQSDQIERFLDATENAKNRPAPKGAAVAGGTDGGRPTLAHRDAAADGSPTPTPQHMQLAEVKGLIKRIDCRGRSAQVTVIVGDSAMVFDMPDPSKIVLKHNSDAYADLSCGDQKPFPVTVGFVPSGRGPTSVAGELKELAF